MFAPQREVMIKLRLIRISVPMLMQDNYHITGNHHELLDTPAGRGMPPASQIFRQKHLTDKRSTIRAIHIVLNGFQQWTSQLIE